MFTIPLTNHDWGSYKQLWQTQLFIKSIGVIWVICDIGGYRKYPISEELRFGMVSIGRWSLRLTDHISTAHLLLFAGFPELFGSIIPQEPPWCCWGLREENTGQFRYWSIFQRLPTLVYAQTRSPIYTWVQLYIYIHIYIYPHIYIMYTDR